jgi:hypothetical protein
MQCSPSLSLQRAQTHICSVLVSENIWCPFPDLNCFPAKGHPKSELGSKAYLELFFSYRREPQPVGRGWACSGRGVKVGVHNIAPQISLALRGPLTWFQSVADLITNCCQPWVLQSLFLLTWLNLSHYKTYEWPALNPLSIYKVTKTYFHYKN